MENEKLDALTEFQRLTRDIREATRTLKPREARYLVDLYYQVQDYRISTKNQSDSMGRDEEPHETIDFFGAQMRAFENQIKKVLDDWTDKHALGVWAKGQVGIGPVISAGLLAHIDFDKATNPSKIWRYAGLDPSVKWEKGKVRPWNASLKVVCWKAGESFVKFSNHERCLYGKLYQERKALEIQRNEAGKFAEQAKNILASKNFSKDTDAYKAYIQGILPPAHIHARAKRFAVKIFLSHFWQKGYEIHYGKTPPDPYVFSELGHADRIPVPA
jgi:hypothetical protein